MITYAEYHAARPLPCGVSLAALIFPPLANEPRGRKVSPLGTLAENRAYARSEEGKFLCAITANNKRIETYRPVMIGKGWKSVAWIAKQAGICPDSVRQRMKRLTESGNIERRKMSDNSILFRWVKGTQQSM